MLIHHILCGIDEHPPMRCGFASGMRIEGSPSRSKNQPFNKHLRPKPNLSQEFLATRPNRDVCPGQLHRQTAFASGIAGEVLLDHEQFRTR
jgi:hypothetical protein